MNSLVRVAPLTRVLTRNCSHEVPSKNFKRLKDTQSKFQCDDGLPVFLKGGAKDKLLYQATFGLIGVGCILSLKVFYDLAKPK